MKYRVLAGKIVEHDYSYDDVARVIGVSPKTLRQKIKGNSPFTWNEVVAMQTNLFPDVDKDTLMRAN